MLGPECIWPGAPVQLGPSSAGEVEATQEPQVPTYLFQFGMHRSPESWNPESLRWQRPHFQTGLTLQLSRGPRAVRGQAGHWTWRGHHCYGHLIAHCALGTREDTSQDTVRTQLLRAGGQLQSDCLHKATQWIVDGIPPRPCLFMRQMNRPVGIRSTARI